jgi:hypothetical protein
MGWKNLYGNETAISVDVIDNFNFYKDKNGGMSNKTTMVRKENVCSKDQPEPT